MIRKFLKDCIKKYQGMRNRLLYELRNDYQLKELEDSDDSIYCYLVNMNDKEKRKEAEFFKEKILNIFYEFIEFYWIDRHYTYIQDECDDKRLPFRLLDINGQDWMLSLNEIIEFENLKGRKNSNKKNDFKKLENWYFYTTENKLNISITEYFKWKK
jgi:hypothetical protein